MDNYTRNILVDVVAKQSEACTKLSILLNCKPNFCGYCGIYTRHNSQDCWKNPLNKVMKAMTAMKAVKPMKAMKAKKPTKAMKAMKT